MLDRCEYKSYSATLLSEMDLTVYAVRRLVCCEVRGGCAELRCAAIKCRKTASPSSSNMVSRYFVSTGQECDVTVRIEQTASEILRIRMQKGGVIEESNWPMLIRDPEVSGELACEETPERLILRGDRMTVLLNKSPFHMEIRDRDGTVLYSQYNDDLHSTTNDRRRGINEAADELELEQIRASYPAFEVYPFGFVEDNITGDLCYTEAVSMAYDEAFYGFGESFSPINKRGEEKLIWTINPLGVSTVKSYKPVPFFMSSRSYGLYLNSPSKSVFDMGSYFFKAYTVASFDKTFDLFFIRGDGYADILKKYLSLTGNCRNVPPKWSFGVWMGRNCYRSRAEMEEIARELRERELPCDVLHLDWDYTAHENGFDFAFDEGRFPCPKQMIEGLREQGYHLSIWQLPYLRKDTPIYNEALGKGYLSSPPPGQTRELDDNGIIDFSNPDARAWYQEKLRALLRQGIAVIKTDFGENADEDYSYHSIDGADMHNLYPLLYNDAAYEVCEEVHGQEALVWGRSAFAGSQRFPLYWGGDSDSDYLGLYHSLRGGLSLGMTGFPFWSYDVGGYFGRPDPDVYIRWMELGMLSSHIRFHGTTAREPWHFGEQAVEIYRKYARLRYSLIEYIYAEARRAVENGTPLMRPLALDFPNDKTVRTIDDQFLLGNSILVAGVFDKAPVRRLYLPAGKWLDWHTGEVICGPGWIDKEIPIDILPIYLRFGSVIPFVDPGLYVGQKTGTAVTWYVLPRSGGTPTGTVYWEGSEMTLCVSGSARRMSLQVSGAETEHRVRIFDCSYPSDVSGLSDVQYDPEHRTLKALLTDVQASIQW